MPVTAGAAALGHVLTPGDQELHLVSLAIIIVQGDKPVTRLQEETLGSADGTLQRKQDLVI